MPFLLKLYLAWLLLSMVATTACAIMNMGRTTEHWTFRLHGYFLNSAGVAWCIGVVGLVVSGFMYL